MQILDLVCIVRSACSYLMVSSLLLSSVISVVIEDFLSLLSSLALVFGWLVNVFIIGLFAASPYGNVGCLA